MDPPALQRSAMCPERLHCLCGTHKDSVDVLGFTHVQTNLPKIVQTLVNYTPTRKKLHLKFLFFLGIRS